MKKKKKKTFKVSDRARKHLQSQFQRPQSPDFTLNSVHQNLEHRYLFNPF